MLSKKKTREIIDVISSMYPDATVALHFNTTFQLLIAVALSAQTTDAAVNKVTPALFEAYPTPEALAKADLSDVMDKIKTIGLYRNKAKNIIACSQQLVDEFHGEVPHTMKELTSLAGVGRKTANVVMSVAFNIPAFAVDTHIERISKRLRIAPEKATVREVEDIITSAIPKERWNRLHHQMIYFGRYFCTAKKPHCAECPLVHECKEGAKFLKAQAKKEEK